MRAPLFLALSLAIVTAGASVSVARRWRHTHPTALTERESSEGPSRARAIAPPRFLTGAHPSGDGTPVEDPDETAESAEPLPSDEADPVLIAAEATGPAQQREAEHEHDATSPAPVRHHAPASTVALTPEIQQRLDHARTETRAARAALEERVRTRQLRAADYPGALLAVQTEARERLQRIYADGPDGRPALAARRPDTAHRRPLDRPRHEGQVPAGP